MNNKNMPAMPSVQTTEQYEVTGAIFVQSKEYFEGLTKREHFAGLAMQAILSNPSLVDNLTTCSVDWIVTKAAIVADAQLAELDKEDQL
jgi:hypothetical protein